MRCVTFINEVKTMEYAVNSSSELLNIPRLSEGDSPVSLEGTDIVMDKVRFSYSGKMEDCVLKEITMKLKEGSFTALVGPSGGGKSTLARLLARFWDVNGGTISIGGKNLKEIPITQLSGLISFVTQDNYLFHCSLKENIRLGKPTASDEEVLNAAKAAQCEAFIGRLKHGWDTPAGEAGKQLSGGEKQRIAIARAILKDAPIVILDEATAFTDPENEEKLQQSIARLTKGKTLLVIAHRLSTIQNADQIIVLHNGSILDRGTQEELLKNCPLYEKLWKAHIGAKHWAVSGSGLSNHKEVELNV
jgi:ATP-binding cassette subfamily B protein